MSFFFSFAEKSFAAGGRDSIKDSETGVSDYYGTYKAKKSRAELEGKIAELSQVHVDCVCRRWLSCSGLRLMFAACVVLSMIAIMRRLLPMTCGVILVILVILLPTAYDLRCDSSYSSYSTTYCP